MNGERGQRTRELTSGQIRGYEGKEKERHEASARQQENGEE